MQPFARSMLNIMLSLILCNKITLVQAAWLGIVKKNNLYRCSSDLKNTFWEDEKRNKPSTVWDLNPWAHGWHNGTILP